MQTGIRKQHHSPYSTTRSMALRGPVLGIILLVWNLLGAADSSNPVMLPRLTGPIQLDGFSNEPAWEAVAPLPMTMLLPTPGGVPTEKTEIRIAYDDDYLYAAGRFYVTDPADIRGNALMRDGGSISDDGFILLLDTFNDNETALIFVTTPAGIREDMTIANDAQPFRGGFPGNKSWNTFWDVAVERNDEGWFAEMRIPFSSLGFQDEDGRITMGLTASRRIASKNEVTTYPSIDPKWNLGIFKPSIAQDVILEGVPDQKPLYITPYLLGGQDRTFELNQAATAYIPVHQPTSELGLDVKYSLTSNLTLDLTLNTDFAQVEVDDEQINFTRFSLFFPEKRLFFQERASVFDFSTGGRNRVFYSRRIGLTDDGPVPIYGGARLVGRVRDWDVGLLTMQTKAAIFEPEADSTVAVPSENFGVLRLRRRVLNEYSYVGGILTSKLSGEGRYDYAYGVDGTLRLFGDDYLTFLWVQNLGDSTDVSLRSLRETDRILKPSRLLEASRLRVNWENRSRQGWSYRWGASRIGALYDPQIGFEQREDYTWTGGELAYSWLPGDTSPIYRFTVSFNNAYFFRNADGLLESSRIGPGFSYEGKSGASSFLWLGWQLEDLPETLELPEDTSVPPGRYSYYNLFGVYRTPSTKLLSARFTVNMGTFYDGQLVSLGVNPTWTLSRFVRLSGEYDIKKAWFPQRQQEFVTHLLGLRVNANLNTELSSNLFIQFNSDADAIGINMRIRYNPREGTDLYLVYIEGFNTDRRRESPVLPFTDSRTVLLKYSTTLWN